jgi:glycosyltransferase involved in cell wall biosynthesis
LATDHDSSDWQLMIGSAQRDTPPRISARERAEHLDEPRVEVSAAHSPAPPVRILLVADMRSPITWGWVDAVRSAGVVVLGSDGLPWPEHRPLAASGEGSRRSIKQRLRSFTGATPRIFKVTGRVRQVVGPVMAPIKGRRIRRTVERAKPDVVHALRIPHEAMAAMAACPPAVPLAVSIWGNDLTHEAPASRMAGRATRRVLARTDLLFADCQRDIDLAGTWGLRPTTPTAVLPGGGGIDVARMAEEHRKLESQLSDLVGPDHRVVVNARGLRRYVRNEFLLEALSLLATELDPRVRIVFVDSAHDAALCRAIEHHQLSNKIIVTGKLSPGEVLSLFRRAEVSVSITDRDGTPNSLLEAMAAGAIPVCSDLPSIREWIEPGTNGFLAPFNDPPAVADALRLALGLSDAERSAIKTENGRIIATRAERGSAGKHAAEKYGQLVMHREVHLAPAGRRHVHSQNER